MEITKGVLWVLLAGITGITQAQANDWSFEFEPYLMGSNIEGDTTVGRAQETAVDVDFSDILETLDVGAMMVFRGQREDGWGFSLDYGFMDLRSDIAGPRGGIANARVRQGVFEVVITRKSEKTDGLEFFTGLRWWDNDIDLTIDPALLPVNPAVSINEDWVDVIVGIQRTVSLNPDWDFTFRGDVGGLGIESDWTASAAIGFRRDISDRTSVNFKYKALWVDYEDGSSGQPGYYAYDTVTHGPIVGLVFKF